VTNYPIELPIIQENLFKTKTRRGLSKMNTDRYSSTRNINQTIGYKFNLKSAMKLTVLMFAALVLGSCSQSNLGSNSKSVNPNEHSPETSISVGKKGSKTTSQPVGFASATDEQARIRLFEKSKDAVVKISTKVSTGSGFIITKDGLVVTNKHVVKNEESQIAEKVKVTLADGTELDADVLGVSRYQDLALIRIPNQTKLNSFKLARSESIRVGQNVYAIGSPFGIENIFTAGILNKVDKSESLLLHDARINSGNSGGPLLDIQGEVIGVNTAIYSKDVEGSSIKNTAISVSINVDRVTKLIAAYKGKLPDFVSIQNIDKRIKLSQLPTTGTEITDRFKSGDDTDSRNIYYRNYSFKGKANQQLTIEMSSTQIDSTLILYFLAEGQEPEQIYENNGTSPKDSNAKFSLILPKDGVYVVTAKTFQPGETGDYQIKATLK
jgi:serine protease Do